MALFFRTVSKTDMITRMKPRATAEAGVVSCVDLTTVWTLPTFMRGLGFSHDDIMDFQKKRKHLGFVIRDVARKLTGWMRNHWNQLHSLWSAWLRCVPLQISIALVPNGEWEDEPFATDIPCKELDSLWHDPDRCLDVWTFLAWYTWGHHTQVFWILYECTEVLTLWNSTLTVNTSDLRCIHNLMCALLITSDSVEGHTSRFKYAYSYLLARWRKTCRPLDVHVKRKCFEDGQEKTSKKQTRGE